MFEPSSVMLPYGLSDRHQDFVRQGKGAAFPHGRPAVWRVPSLQELRAVPEPRISTLTCPLSVDMFTASKTYGCRKKRERKRPAKIVSVPDYQRVRNSAKSDRDEVGHVFKAKSGKLAKSLSAPTISVKRVSKKRPISRSVRSSMLLGASEDRPIPVDTDDEEIPEATDGRRDGVSLDWIYSSPSTATNNISFNRFRHSPVASTASQSCSSMHSRILNKKSGPGLFLREGLHTPSAIHKTPRFIKRSISSNQEANGYIDMMSDVSHLSSIDEPIPEPESLNPHNLERKPRSDLVVTTSRWRHKICTKLHDPTAQHPHSPSRPSNSSDLATQIKSEHASIDAARPPRSNTPATHARVTIPPSLILPFASSLPTRRSLAHLMPFAPAPSNTTTPPLIKIDPSDPVFKWDDASPPPPPPATTPTRPPRPRHHPRPPARTTAPRRSTAARVRIEPRAPNTSAKRTPRASHFSGRAHCADACAEPAGARRIAFPGVRGGACASPSGDEVVVGVGGWW
ncbi:hypothetical protein ACN47E_007492 [Coniothyrium glycines]